MRNLLRLKYEGKKNIYNVIYILGEKWNTFGSQKKAVLIFGRVLIELRSSNHNRCLNRRIGVIIGQGVLNNY